MTAREHAIFASQLLDNLQDWQDQLQNLTPDQRLQMSVTGGVKQVNAAMEFTLASAQAHGLAALAMQATGGDLG
jgi:conjugal transfer/entry exclusion protein